jgi:hypothetical protein
MMAGQIGVLFSGSVYQYAVPLRSEVSRTQFRSAAASWLEITFDADPEVYRQRTDLREDPFACVLASYLTPDPDPELFNPPYERGCGDEALTAPEVQSVFNFSSVDMLNPE